MNIEDLLPYSTYEFEIRALNKDDDETIYGDLKTFAVNTLETGIKFLLDVHSQTNDHVVKFTKSCKFKWLSHTSRSQ